MWSSTEYVFSKFDGRCGSATVLVRHDQIAAVEEVERFRCKVVLVSGNSLDVNHSLANVIKRIMNTSKVMEQGMKE